MLRLSTEFTFNSCLLLLFVCLDPSKSKKPSQKDWDQSKPLRADKICLAWKREESKGPVHWSAQSFESGAKLSEGIQLPGGTQAHRQQCMRGNLGVLCMHCFLCPELGVYSWFHWADIYWAPAMCQWDMEVNKKDRASAFTQFILWYREERGLRKKN
jgi:hypothetical protein